MYLFCACGIAAMVMAMAIIDMKTSKKIKKIQKPIDKYAILWYNIDAEEKRGSQVPHDPKKERGK